MSLRLAVRIIVALIGITDISTPEGRAVPPLSKGESGGGRSSYLTALLAPESFAEEFHVPSLQTPPGAGGHFGDREQINRELKTIRDQPEFRRLRKLKPKVNSSESKFEWPQWLKDFFEWLGDLFRPIRAFFAGLGYLMTALAWAVVAGIGALIIWLVVRAVQNYQARQSARMHARHGHDEGEAEIPPGDLPADEYLRRASELAERGQYREAIGQLILGAMSRTERSGLIRFRRGLTHCDYLRALRGRETPHQSFKQIVSVYEPICFGRRPAQMDHYLTSLDGYKTGFLEPLAAGGPPEKNSQTGRQPIPALS
jgi:hypothetical protein